MQDVSAWIIAAAGGGAGGGLPIFKDIKFTLNGSQLKLEGKGLSPANVAAIKTAVCLAYPQGAKPNGLSLRGASQLRHGARASGSRAPSLRGRRRRGRELRNCATLTPRALLCPQRSSTN